MLAWVDKFYFLNWNTNTGKTKTKPIIDELKPGAINNNEIIPRYHLWKVDTVLNKYPVKPTPINPIPIIADIKVTKKS